MTNSSLGYSLIEEMTNNPNNSNNNRVNKRQMMNSKLPSSSSNNKISDRRKTRKNRVAPSSSSSPSVSMKVEQFLNSLDESDDEDDENSNSNLGFSMGNLPPMPYMTSLKGQQQAEGMTSGTGIPYQTALHKTNENLKKQVHKQPNEDVDNEVTMEGYNNLENDIQSKMQSQMDKYYSQYQYIPYYTNPSNNQSITGSKDLLIEKLNYMIHLLEEQQEEKTGHITEELILYSFLGIFIIFVIDSFTKAGKYVR
jgi:hypothetical protein